MTREQSWQTEGVTLTVLQHIQSLGYAVSVHRLDATVVCDDGANAPMVIPGPEYVEMHAVNLANPDEQHIARCMDGEGEAESYPAACERARMNILAPKRAASTSIYRASGSNANSSRR